ncbi:hypothetical protein BDZ94DRAFT_618865 [Collybia nuda]|uniref:Uncharacterized protein n=1 Tax=Collybia nuda TaxID=64659 RepID=A0A9P5Y4T9_9AGAR|nr:hypothetical protein BDZ94DRAFT_618865 [Collybia nuda]
MLKPAKVSVYTQRNSTSIPAPLEVDSDSDFAPGAFIPEPKVKRKRGAASTSTGARIRGKRRSDILETSIYASSRSEKKRLRSLEAHKPNPLLEFFAQDLNLHSESEGENDFGSTEGKELEEDDQDEDEDKKEQEEPVVLKTWAGFVRNNWNKIRLSPPPPQQLSENSNEADNSATESDSQPEQDFFKVPEYQRHPNKKPRLDNPEDHSVTESDSEGDVWVSQPGAHIIFSSKHIPDVHFLATTIHKKVQLPVTDSETEPESESEMTADPLLKPRPGFPLAPGQMHLGPLVLDRGEKIMVPAALNTYLRDYQRDGVRFFWRQYQEGRGGLLGDDMGLVCDICIIPCILPP